MGDRAGGLSRRHFLVLSGGGAAVLWAGHAPLARALNTAPLGAVLGDTAPRLRALPFADDFVNVALPEWNVRRAVSFVGATPYGATLPATASLDRADFLRGRGTVLALDGGFGSSTTPGLIETVDTFVFEPGTYTLRFTVAGSHQSADRMPLSSVTASLPGLGASTYVTRMPDDDFLEFTLEVAVARPAISTIVLASGDAPGQAGVLLECISLTRNA